MKTELTESDRDEVWHSADVNWLHYAWQDGQWWTFPCDPRSNPLLTNKFPAHGQTDGVLKCASGFIKASPPKNLVRLECDARKEGRVNDA